MEGNGREAFIVWQKKKKENEGAKQRQNRFLQHRHKRFKGSKGGES